MTPKERARDLCEKFEGILGRSIPTGDDPFFPESKECAKMCVQEIIEGIESIIGDQKHFWKEGEKEMHEYYTEVLKAIDTI